MGDTVFGNRYWSVLMILFRAIFLGVILTGCAHYPLNPAYEGPAPLPSGISAQYAHEKFRGDYTEAVRHKRKGYTIKRIEFASVHNIVPIQHTIIIDYYAVSGSTGTPVIVVLPILGGGNSVAKKFAGYFASRGYAAAIVHRQDKYKEVKAISKIDMTLRQMVFDHKQALDWIETRPELDSERIGVFGISMGGIKSALVAALDERVRAAILGLTAGDIPHILAHSDEKGVRKRRKRYLEAEGLTPDTFYERLKQEITCDPIRYAAYIDARNVLMILARFDRIIPYARGRILWKKMGEPEVIFLLSGHYSAIPFIPYIKMKSFEFFRRKFGDGI